MKHDVCFASFKYPSLSRGGVKRPDDILYPGALTERHEKAQQCYQARMFRHFFLFSFTWTCSWQCSMGLPSFCRGQAGTWPAEGNNIRNLTLLYQEQYNKIGMIQMSRFIFLFSWRGYSLHHLAQHKKRLCFWIHFHLNGVNIVGDHHKLGLLLLNQGGHLSK